MKQGARDLRRNETLGEDDWNVLYREAAQEFSPGVPIREKDLFAGRAAQILTLLDVVEQAGKHAAVFGDPGVGKTSLATTFAIGSSLIADQVYTVRVNAENDDSFSKLWRRIFKKFAIEFRKNGVIYQQTLSDQYEDSIGPEDVQFELEHMSANCKPIIVIDEFNQIVDRSVTGEISRLIKNISDFSLNCSIVIVGVAKDVSALIEGHNSITRQLVQVSMPRMHMDELSQLVRDRVTRLGMTVDDDVLWKMCFITRGMPFFAHLLGLHSSRAAILERDLRISDNHLNVGIRSALGEVDQNLRDTYINGTASAKDNTLFQPVLLACALAESDELGRFQQKDVEEPLARLTPGKRYKATTYAFHINEFCEAKRLRILETERAADGARYRFSDPLMQPYVILKGIDSGLIGNEIAESFVPPRQPSLPI